MTSTFSATATKDRLYFFDTTLRDGAQTPGVKFRSEDKLRVAAALHDLGLDYIELGWPGANPTDTKVFEDWARTMAATGGNGKTRTVSFGMCKDPRKSLDNDATLKTVLAVEADTYCLFGKSWDYQARLLGAGPEDYLETVRASVAGAAARGEAIIDAEHFFQGYEANPAYALDFVKTAYDAGARWVVLCDTNGRMTPAKVARIVSEVTRHVPGTHLGIHAHNDRGMADANTLAAIEAGCRHVQGTVNGLGERCGNANWINVLGNLSVDPDFRDTYDTGFDDRDLLKLRPLAHLVAEVTRTPLPRNMPFVGDGSGEQKAGKHVDMFKLDPDTYRSHNPALFGVEEKISVSNQSGISNFLPHLERMGLDTSKGNMALRDLVAALKQAEEDGFDFEGSMGSFEVLALHVYGQMPAYFKLSSYRAMVERTPANGTPSAMEKFKLAAQATVEFMDGSGALADPEVSNGNGPVNAIDRAMRRSLEATYPELRSLRLTNYTQRVLNSRDGTDAIMQVQITSYAPAYGEMVTFGVSGNSIDASVNALMDSYMLHLKRMGVAARALPAPAAYATGTQPR